MPQCQNINDDVGESDMPEKQQEFFKRNGSGCAFAAAAARDMQKYGWKQAICDISADEIDREIEGAISDASISTLSLIFPTIKTDAQMSALLSELQKCKLVFLEEKFEVGTKYGFRFRAIIGDLHSWISGFGPFDYLPETRRSPSVEMTIRVKPRPEYEWHFKASPPGVIHLADLNMLGLPDKKLWKLWGVSFLRTKKLLGHDPDAESAAKTTFVIPKNIID